MRFRVSLTEESVIAFCDRRMSTLVEYYGSVTCVRPVATRTRFLVSEERGVASQPIKPFSDGIFMSGTSGMRSWTAFLTLTNTIASKRG